MKNSLPPVSLYLFYLILLLFVLSCKKKALSPLQFERVLVLGNSITIHPPNPAVEWHANWGMAASSAEKDFTHLLAAKMNAKTEAINISAWERNHSSFKLSALDHHFLSKPDLIIVRLGENVEDLTHLDQSFSNMIDYVTSKKPLAKTLITGTFWKNDPLDSILSKVAQEKSIHFVPLSHLDRTENKSYLGASIFHIDRSSYEVKDQGVADHPGDLGMEQIANTIFTNIKDHFKE